MQKKHLYPKQLKRHGLTAAKAKLADGALYALIDNYTREAGVRQLEREIASLLRKAAKRIVSGEEKKVVVDNDNIVSILGPRKFRPELISPHDEIGGQRACLDVGRRRVAAGGNRRYGRHG